MLRVFFSFLLLNTWACSIICIDSSALYARSTLPYVANFNSEGFAAQNFTLWDIDEDSPGTTTYQQHYAGLVTFVQTNYIRRVIVYPKDPDYNPFFLLSKQNVKDPNTFAYYIQQLVNLGCQVEIQFDYSNFAESQPFTPVYTYNNTQIPSNDFYFANLPQKMNWVAGIMKLIPQVRGVTIDPEDSDNTQGNTAYQLIINYMDMYRYDSSNQVPNMKTGMTFGINVRNFSFANATNFTYNASQPVYYQYTMPSCYTATLQRFPGVPYVDKSVSPSVTYPNEDISSWRPSPVSTAPLLDTVYIQAYEDDMPYIFTLSSNPELAGQALVNALSGIPYVPCTGTITTTKNSKSVVGSGTSFTSDLVGLPIGVGVVPNVTTIGIVNSVTDSTHLTLNGPATAVVSQQPYLTTEISMKWVFPYASKQTANRIYLMFSVETDAEDGHQFFGTWTLNEFMSFVKAFYAQGQVQGIYQAPPGSSTSYCTAVGNPSMIPLPNNFAIFTYYKLLQTNWFPSTNN